MAFLSARTLSAFSSQVQAVAVGWQIYMLTHSARALAWVGLAQFLPMFCLTLVAGHVADHFDRRLVVTTCQALEACGALVMAVGSFNHWLTPPMIYGMVALFGTARTFEMPSQQTFLPALVPATLFPRASALSASLFQVASIMGPSLGGLLYGVGAGFSYSVCAVGFGMATVATFNMRLEAPTRVRRPMTIATVLGGLHFIRAQPEMLGAISLDLFAVLLGGATAMLPLYANDILHAGPLGLGDAAVTLQDPWGRCVRHGVRALAARRAGHAMFAAVAVFGLATIVFGLSRSLPVSILALAVLGGADVISVVVRGALVQLRTPDEMRGRVSAVNMLFIGSSNQLGEFESGMLASLIGPVEAVVLGGIGTIVVTLLWMRMFPALRRLDRLDDIRPAK
nr:MFS transporter [Gluconacetobacter diazotrophicus]